MTLIFWLFFSPSGRIDRSQFLTMTSFIYSLFLLLLLNSHVALDAANQVVFTDKFSNVLISEMSALILLHLSLWTLFSKRLHDIGCSGSWSILYFIGLLASIQTVPAALNATIPYYIGFIPLALSIFMLLLCSLYPGDSKTNRFGHPYEKMHLLKKQKNAGNLNPFHNTAQHTLAPSTPTLPTPSRNPSHIAHVAPPTVYRVLEMRRAYAQLQQQNLSLLKEKMLIMPTKEGHSKQNNEL